MTTLTKTELQDLKAKAQRLNPVLKVGKHALSEEFLAEFRHTQESHPLLKVQFAAHKDEKKALTAKLAELTDSIIVHQVGNVAVFYKPKM
jgi:RNA-binding protein